MRTGKPTTFQRDSRQGYPSSGITWRLPSINSATIALASRSRSPSGISSRPCRSIMQTLRRSPLPAVFVLPHRNGGGNGQAAAAIVTGAVGSHVDYDRAGPHAVICLRVASKSPRSVNRFNSRTFPWTRSTKGKMRCTAAFRRAIVAASAERQYGSQLRSSDVARPRARAAWKSSSLPPPSIGSENHRSARNRCSRRRASLDQRPTSPANSCSAANR